MLALAVGVFVLLLVWVAVRGWLAKGHLENTQTLVPRLEQQARTGDATGAQQSLARLQDETGAARRLTGDPVWALMTTLPVVGDDLAAVRGAASVVDDVATDGLPPLVQVSSTVQPSRLQPVDGRVDLAPLEAAQQPLRRADAALAAASRQLAPHRAAADAGSLLGPVSSAVTSLDDSVLRVASDTATASRAADLLPPMLGAEGKRRYLVIFQNLAEARSLGGLVGAVAVVEADDGKLVLTKQGDASAVPLFDEPVRRIDGEGLYAPAPARYFQNITQPIDFTVTGRLARDMWQRTWGQKLDGVVATDPVALSYLLQGTGPVTLPTGRVLTSRNAVSQLLNRAYFEIDDPAAQNVYFATVAGSIFGKVTAGGGDSAKTLSALARAAGEHRLLAWSARRGEQSRLAGTVLEGRLPTVEPENPTVGVFLNDGTGSKMSYYLRSATTLTDVCRDEGLRGTRVSTKLTSTAPARGLPLSVTGPGSFGAPKYTTRTVVYLVGRLDGSMDAVTVDGEKRAVTTAVIGGRVVASLQVDLEPGQSATIATEMAGPDVPGRTRLRSTPGVAPNETVIKGSVCHDQ